MPKGVRSNFRQEAEGDERSSGEETEEHLIFNKEKIYEAIWYNEYIYDERNMITYINKIRRKIESDSVTQDV